MKRTAKKLLALLLSTVLVVSVCSVSAFAASTIQELDLTCDAEVDGNYYLFAPAATDSDTVMIFEVVQKSSISVAESEINSALSSFVGNSVGTLQLGTAAVAGCDTFSGSYAQIDPYDTGATMICVYEISTTPDLSGYHEVYAIGYEAVGPLTADDVEILTPTVNGNEVTLAPESGYDYYYGIAPCSSYTEAQDSVTFLYNAYANETCEFFDSSGLDSWTGTITVDVPNSVLAIGRVKTTAAGQFLTGFCAVAFEGEKVQALTPTVNGNEVSLTPEAGYSYYYEIVPLADYAEAVELANTSNDIIGGPLEYNIDVTGVPEWTGSVTVDGPAVLVIMKLRTGTNGFVGVGFYAGAFDAADAGGGIEGETNPPAGENNPPPGSVPTGDSNNAALWGTLMGLAAVGLVGAVILSRKKRA